MATMLGLFTWTVKINSASKAGKLSLKDVKSMEMTSKAGSFGLAVISAAVVAAVVAPIMADGQLHFCGFVVVMVWWWWLLLFVFWRIGWNES